VLNENGLHRLGATMSVLRERSVEISDGTTDKKVAEVLVRWVPENQQVANALRSFLYEKSFVQ